ncbi:MAG TPA: hypothetical protein GX745_07305 [Clostridiales bacterium]|nr:hypothetical protein [Clostridiales bacterium]
MNSLKNICLLIIIICLLIHSYILSKTSEELKKSHDDILKMNEKLISDKKNLMRLVKDLEKDKLKSPSRNMISRNVPENNSRKTYMDYRKITDTSSEQYKLQQNKDCYTTDTGLRKVNEYYCIAVGTHYSNNIGDKLIIHMENGESFKAIVADIKDDKHTDETNRQHRKDGSVIEFVVDTKKLPELVRKMGDISYMNETFKGEIKAIIKEVK